MEHHDAPASLKAQCIKALLRYQHTLHSDVKQRYAVALITLARRQLFSEQLKPVRSKARTKLAERYN